jgi:FkbH-like protein
MNKKRYKGFITADFTIYDLKNFIVSDSDFPQMDITTAPYNQVSQVLLQKDEIAAGGYDFLLIWTRPETMLPSINSAMQYCDVQAIQLLAETDDFCRLIKQSLHSAKYIFIPTWTIPTYVRGWGMLDCKKDKGIANLVGQANQRLAQNLSDAGNVIILNTQKWIETAGKNAYSPKMWYMAKAPYSNSVLSEAAKDIKAAINGLEGNAKKLIIVDLDNTLWGGIVGDTGWENLSLGGHNHIGEAFVDFQRSLKDMKNRGLLLGIVSKNDETTALNAIESNPEMVLKESDFVGWRINWEDKAKNIVELVRQLNLGLQSVVFLDDNPHERARVREALPEVLVPEMPEDKMLYRSFLLSLKCFDAPFMTAEDKTRTELYKEKAERELEKESYVSLGEWLMTLGTKVTIENMSNSNSGRIVQLLNKTNQMNLSTRRMTQEELEKWLNGGDRKLLAIRVEDKFGDSGLTGILSFEIKNGNLWIIDYVLSCRVMGRKIEETMLFVVYDFARTQNLNGIYAEFIPTEKNKPCFDFLSTSGMQYDNEKKVFSIGTEKEYSKPASVTIIDKSGGAFNSRNK